MVKFVESVGVGLSVSGGVLATAWQLPDQTVIMAWVGMAITVGTALYPKVKTAWFDWRKSSIELDTLANRVVKQSVEDIVKQNVADLTTKVDLLEQRITELTIKLDNWALKLTDALPANKD